MNQQILDIRADDIAWTNGSRSEESRKDEKFKLATKPHLAAVKKPRRRAGIHRRRNKRML